MRKFLILALVPIFFAATACQKSEETPAPEASAAASEEASPAASAAAPEGGSMASPAAGEAGSAPSPAAS